MNKICSFDTLCIFRNITFIYVLRFFVYFLSCDLANLHIYEVVHSSEIFQYLIQTIVHIILQILLEILNLGHGQYTETNVFIFIVRLLDLLDFPTQILF